MSEFNQFPPTLKWPNANKRENLEEITKQVVTLKNGGQAEQTIVPDGHPVRLFFPFGDFKEQAPKNGFGMSFMYKADLNGERHTIFANGKLHEALQRGGVGPTITLEVKRNVVPMTNDDGTPWLDQRGKQRVMTEFEVSRVATEDGSTVDEFVEAMGGDVVGGAY